MRKSTKHQNQQTKAYETFEGGLNTAAAEEFIGENQLSECINMHCDAVTRKLVTVKGTIDLVSLKKQFPQAEEILFGAWDNINEYLLVFTKNGEIYATDDFYDRFELAGELTGAQDVVTCSWEDGILIASGGKLQYGKLIGDKYKVITLDNSPESCRCVFIRSGRVIIFGHKNGDETDDFAYYSAVGDEETWDEDVNDPSMSVFAQIGYKVGGKLLAACNLGPDILFVKDNGMCYRLENEYPDWKIKEVGRQVYCYNPNSICSAGGASVIMVGAHNLYKVVTTEEYGDIRPEIMGRQIEKQISYLPKYTKMRYLPALNQIWFISEERYVLVYDADLGTFFQRYFNSDVVDVVNVVSDVIIIKKDKVCKLDNDSSKCEDDGQPLQIRARLKSEASISDYLVKQVFLSVTPLRQFYETPNVTVSIGRIELKIPKRVASADGFLKQTVGVTQAAIEPQGEFITDSTSPNVVFNPDNLSVGKSVLLKSRKLFRGERIRLYIKGEGFPFVLNYIAYDRVEV